MLNINRPSCCGFSVSLMKPEIRQQDDFVDQIRVRDLVKIKIRLIAITIVAFLIHCSNANFLGARESGVALASEDTDKTKALEWGFRFASAIPENPHVADRSKSQYQILEVYIERDMPDEVAERAGRIADWRECLSYADLAVHFARMGGDEKFRLYLQRARECLHRITGWQTSWQRDRISLRIAEAQVIAGQLNAAEKTEAELPAESASLARALRLSRMDGPGDYEKSVNQLQSMEISKHMEVQRDIGRAYIAILRQLGTKATAEQCVSLQTRVYEVAERLPQPLQHEVLCSLGRAAFAVGRKEMGHGVLEYSEGKLKGRELKARFDVKALVAVAEIWDEKAQEPQRAQSMLDQARELLMKSSLKGNDRVSATLSLAHGFVIHGRKDPAWDLFRQALHMASSQKNARPRAMAITDICAVIGSLGMSLPDEMGKELKRQYEALGDPW